MLEAWNIDKSSWFSLGSFIPTTTVMEINGKDLLILPVNPAHYDDDWNCKTCPLVQ